MKKFSCVEPKEKREKKTEERYFDEKKKQNKKNTHKFSWTQLESIYL